MVHNYLSIRWILEQGVGNYRSINRLLIEANSQKPFSPKSDNDKTEISVFDSWLIVLNYFTYIIIGTPILKIEKKFWYLESIKSQEIWADRNFEEVWDF